MPCDTRWTVVPAADMALQGDVSLLWEAVKALGFRQAVQDANAGTIKFLDRAGRPVTWAKGSLTFPAATTARDAAGINAARAAVFDELRRGYAVQVVQRVARQLGRSVEPVRGQVNKFRIKAR